MNRRGFLGAILAAGVAPFVVRAESLMALRVPVGGLISGTGQLVFSGPPTLITPPTIGEYSLFLHADAAELIKEMHGGFIPENYHFDRNVPTFSVHV